MNREICSCLDFLKPLYPGGIPENLIRSAKTSLAQPSLNIKGGAEPKLLFVGRAAEKSDPLSGEEGELLKAAVTKGLKIGVDEICFAQILCGNNAEAGSAGALLSHEVQRLRPGCIVVLGSETLSALCSAAESGARGRWADFGGCPMLLTHDLAAVITSQARKKEFWNDLKLVMEKLRQ